MELTAQNYKARCFSLQSELDTSEAVQKDFVQLSQSLQIQLEKIRQSEQVDIYLDIFIFKSVLIFYKLLNFTGGSVAVGRRR